MSGDTWRVDAHPAVEAWLETLSQDDGEALVAAVRVLRAEGPALGRPLVDSVKGSRHKNMKELRPGSTGRTEIRVLFAFDRRRAAILLVGGDKRGDWKGWYAKNIPVADDRLAEHERSHDEATGDSDGAQGLGRAGPRRARRGGARR